MIQFIKGFISGLVGRSFILDNHPNGSLFFSGWIFGDSVNENSKYILRRLTPIEFERLQTVPDNYTDCVSNTQRYKMLGNGWTIDMICFILSFAYSA